MKEKFEQFKNYVKEHKAEILKNAGKLCIFTGAVTGSYFLGKKVGMEIMGDGYEMLIQKALEENPKMTITEFEEQAAEITKKIIEEM